MPQRNDLSELPGDVANLARDAAYVFVGLGVLGFQRAQVQRVELQNKLAVDVGVEDRMADLREAVLNGLHQVDELVEAAFRFVEATLEPIEEQLPTVAREMAKRAHEQAREVHTQLRELVAPAA